MLDRSRNLVDTVWLGPVDEPPRLEEDPPASVDKLSGVDMLVAPEKVVGVALAPVGELETDGPDELAPGSLVEPAKLVESPVLVPPNDPEMDSEPLVD